MKAIIDIELLTLGLRIAGLLGYEGESLEQLFRDEFNVEGVNEGALSTVLAVAMIADAEQRIRCKAGGRN